MSLSFSEFQNLGFLEEIADTFGVGENAGILLERFGFPEGDIPANPESSASFWRIICREISRGRTTHDLDHLIVLAADMYPGNAVFQSYGSRQSNTMVRSGASIYIPGVQNAGEVLDVVLKYGRKMDIGPLETAYSSEGNLCIYLTEQDMDVARRLAREVGRALNNGFAVKGRPDYLYSRMMVEGFDQRRLELIDIPNLTYSNNMEHSVNWADPKAKPPL